MSISDEERSVIVEYRFERSLGTLEEAKKLLGFEMYNVCANRIYYAIFYAISALLISRGIPTQSHTGADIMFQMKFVKTGIIAKEHAKTLKKAFALRQRCDYDDFIDATKEELEPLITETEAFINVIESLLHI